MCTFLPQTYCLFYLSFYSFHSLIHWKFDRSPDSLHLHIAQGLKSLTIENIPISRSDAAKSTFHPLLQLQSLHIRRVWTWDPAPDSSPILDAPSLRQIVIAPPKGATQPIVQAGLHSIETVIWTQYRHGHSYPIIDLGVLQNLRTLCFVLRGGDGDDPFVYTTWDPISKILSSGMIAQTLEKLSFAIKQGWDDPAVVPILRFVGQGDMRTDLADKQQFPRPAKVVVHLVDGGREPPMLDAHALCSAVSQKLPLLVEAGLLHTVAHKRFEWHNLS